MNTSSSSPPYPLCSIFYNASTCDGYSQFPSSLLSHELNLEMTQDSENIHDEEESDEIIKNSFHIPYHMLFCMGTTLRISVITRFF